MTDDELQAIMEKTQRKMKRLLQMPPVVKARTKIEKVLGKDPALQGFDTSTYVFTDITYGIENKDRLIVVREPNGTLKHAQWSQRHRLNQIYFPMPGRMINMPKMFTGDYFKDLLKKHKYEFILDRACCQFEPDDPEFQKIRDDVYNHVNQERLYDLLRSTRHFGPMSFFLVWNKDMDNLLLDVIQNGKIEEAVSLIKLYHIIHPDAKSATKAHDGNDIEFVKSYANLDAASRVRIKNAIATYEEIERERQNVNENIKKSHVVEVPQEDI